MADALPRMIVAAAVIRRGDDFLVTRRLGGTHLPGLWEFPGGKCEPGESLNDCVRREIREELGADLDVGHEILSCEHAYANRVVVLHFFACGLLGTPAPLLGQEMRWVRRAELRSLQFPPADDELIAVLERG